MSLPLPHITQVWNGGSVAAAGVSGSVNVSGLPFISAWGSIDQAGTMAAQFSHDGAAWYTSNTTQATSGGEFGFNFTCAAKFVRLKSIGTGNVTAYIGAKR